MRRNREKKLTSVSCRFILALPSHYQHGCNIADDTRNGGTGGSRLDRRCPKFRELLSCISAVNLTITRFGSKQITAYVPRMEDADSWWIIYILDTRSVEEACISCFPSSPGSIRNGMSFELSAISRNKIWNSREGAVCQVLTLMGIFGSLLFLTINFLKYFESILESIVVILLEYFFSFSFF